MTLTSKSTEYDTKINYQGKKETDTEIHPATKAMITGMPQSSYLGYFCFLSYKLNLSATIGIKTTEFM